MDAKVTPAWRWSHSASACTQDPKHGPTLLPSLHIPLPNNRTPHLRCGKGPSNSTTSETEAVTPHSPTPTQPEASHSSGCAQHAKVALLASQVQPRLALPTAAAEGPIAPPPASPAGPTTVGPTGLSALVCPALLHRRAGCTSWLLRLPRESSQHPHQFHAGLTSLSATTRCMLPPTHTAPQARPPR